MSRVTQCCVAVAEHRGVPLASLDDVLVGTPSRAQTRWASWLQQHGLADRVLRSFEDVVERPDRATRPWIVAAVARVWRHGHGVPGLRQGDAPARRGPTPGDAAAAGVARAVGARAAVSGGEGGAGLKRGADARRERRGVFVASAVASRSSQHGRASHASRWSARRRSIAAPRAPGPWSLHDQVEVRPDLRLPKLEREPEGPGAG